MTTSSIEETPRRGAPTFYGCRPGADGDVVVVGLPFHWGATRPSGVGRAPHVLRGVTTTESLHRGELWDRATGKRFLDRAHVTDLGDIQLKATRSRHSYLDYVEAAIQSIHDAGKRTLAFGGDHLVTLPCVRGVCAARGAIQIVQIDAHTDYMVLDDEDAEPTHASFVHDLACDERVARIVQIGIRGISGDEPLALPSKIVHARPQQIVEALLPEIPVYLTIDTDGFDPMLAPAVDFPMFGGLAWVDLQTVLEGIRRAGLALVGADWTEYSPDNDTKSFVTAHAIAHQLLHVIRALVA